ncbi:hypothetical protein ERO13_D11G308300v2, partial [Gossypium hirsutum]
GDCCKWIGVVCHNLTGHVHQLHLAAPLSPYEQSALGGKINPSLLELNHLSTLDLSNNNFSSIHIPKLFGLLESLTYLNLSRAQFQGAIPHNLGNLSKLQYLDLRGNDLISESLQWVSGLSSLQYLDLSYANLSKATDWLQVTFKHPSLLELHLSTCILEDDPHLISVNSSKSLAVLDLSWNSLSSVPKSIFSLHGLVSIDLRFSSLDGPIPDYFGNISFLEVLDLHQNSINSSIPNSVFCLNHLRFLHLSSNKIQQDISEILQNNQLSGHLTCQLGQFKNLSYLSLAQNNISGPIPSSIGELSSLKYFDVSENQLNGTFPLCFGQLESLETLDFGYNLLEGVVIETHFSELTRLTTLKASHNRLRFEPNSSWIPPFQCQIIELGHWHLGSKFPLWLKFQKELSSLDISHVGISYVMPTWFVNLPTQLEYLNLFYNQLTGGISYLNVTNSIDLSSNRFTCPVPRVLSTLRYLFLSNNSFSGSLSELICNPSLKEMVALYIDINLLIGEIPYCWNHWENLAYLNLGNNNLTGKIPPTLGYTNPFMLDLSENHFSGSVPTWIGDKLSNLVVLSLRSNNFDGYIPRKICDLQFLQNLDLGHNNISGVIPKCFSNLSEMATKNKTNNELSTPYFIDYPFYLKALLVLKGREDEYGSTLGLVTSLDLSANRLRGEIPKEIGSLVGLLSLNFSGNLLTGNIPDNIGNMELMESLDLSMNRLNGEIPPSFSNLNFLNHFNSYVGNHLCGPPLTKNCTSKNIPTDVGNKGRKVNWLYVSIVFGFVLGFWSVVAPLFFIRSWRIAYYQKLDQICDPIS